ncbi:S41 family peptidase [Elizabethkingia ursingii]|uniref:S41 family peptidase n=1 Tax=Elizabethkingia ursingii TaxID=1756150 RepID=UPI002011C29D|nr:S41 family peptidase [Elizabethkingia ursingii]MCL1665830.1 S41 family peptidase [Elizabethkingia ursingii]
MKRNFIKIPFLAIGFTISALSINSCVKEDEVSITEPTRYTKDDVKSYGDLFKLFWTVMDERYNYFYEQKRKDGMDWDAIYKEYYPKFAALKSYKQEGFTDQEKDNDAKKAEEYFAAIIEPIIDRHFIVGIQLPVGRMGVFRGDSKSKKNNVYNFTNKRSYVINKLTDNSLTVGNFTSNGKVVFRFLAGNLKSNPDIYYLTSDGFSFYNLIMEPADQYLIPIPGDTNVLTQAAIDSSADLNAIKDITQRNNVRDFTLDILNKWNNFFTSADVRNFNEGLKVFKNTEEVSDTFVTAANSASTKSLALPDYASSSTYSSVRNTTTQAYIDWFMERIKSHVENAYNYPKFKDDLPGILYRMKFYQKLFNPLQRGEIKKLIIDLRDNGGGAVVDFKYFIERFVTKNAIYAYQRTKEGTGRFNYTPWVPVEAKKHQYAMLSNIPITILTDKGSMSMSELSTLMLKSQGSQVISIGDYTAGGTAGLTTDLDQFNGGINNLNGGFTFVAGLMRFYVPVMATKDTNGEVIEGIGIKPNIYVTPPTDEEVETLKNSPGTFVDRVMNEAIKYLSSK